MLYLSYIVILSAMLVQLTAAIVALFLLRIIGKNVAWILISIALFLMVGRRLFSFLCDFTGHHIPMLDLFYEPLGFVLSILLLVGIIKIIPVFTSLRRALDEKQEMLAELRDKTLLVESVVETTIDGILVVNPEGKVILYNENFVQMFNIPQEILAAKDGSKFAAYSLKNLKDPNKFLKEIKELNLHKDRKSRDEVEFKDGKVLDRYSSPLIDVNGKDQGRAWFFRDITDQKRAVKEKQAMLMRIQDEKLLSDSLVNTTVDGILVVNPAGKTILFNENFVQMFNIPKEILATKDGSKFAAYSLKNLKDPNKFLKEIKELNLHKDRK
ncbi:MAG: PAS-domain containing protein, partial [Gammaproteobacteria bacterium]|nr:PAS-domain containing protein [Gammaproteobacteria bacterium]